MYMWKYWRETRLVFGISLFVVSLLFGQFLKSNLLGDNLASHPRESIAHLFDLPTLPFFQAAPIAFLSWIMGSFGVGCTLGEMGGSYLFSRPRGRGYFVWRDWGFGMAQLLLVIILLNLVFGFQIHHWIVSAGDRFHGSLVLLGRPVTLSTLVCMNTVAESLFAGLVFGLTYFSTIVVKSVRGIILGAGVPLGYVALNMAVGSFWPSIHLPSLLLAVHQQFISSLPPATGHADISFAVSAATRFVVLLIFPIAALILLQKRDIE
jgi:hypothetical protein